MNSNKDLKNRVDDLTVLNVRLRQQIIDLEGRLARINIEMGELIGSHDDNVQRCYDLEYELAKEKRLKKKWHARVKELIHAT